LSQAFLLGTSLEPAVTPTAQAPSLLLLLLLLLLLASVRHFLATTLRLAPCLHISNPLSIKYIYQLQLFHLIQPLNCPHLTSTQT
jgi:hypothetical protein